MTTNNFSEPLGPLLTRTSRAVTNMLQKMFSDEGFDITVEQWVILANLYFRHDGQVQQQLADRTFKSKGVVARILDSMQKRGLVMRFDNENDRRQKEIYITPKGKKLLQDLLPVAERAQNKAQQLIEPDDLAVCTAVLGRIFNNVTGKS
jgi:DNA-binding MarR family transcriptional regulator